MRKIFNLGISPFKLLVVLLITTNFISTVSAQRMQTMHGYEYGIEEREGFIKANYLYFDIGSLISGDLGISYNARLSDWFSLETGAGVLLPYYTMNVYEQMEDDVEIIDPNGGYSCFIYPKFYYHNYKKAPYEMTIGVKFRVRDYSFDEYNIKYKTVIPTVGIVYFLGMRLFFAVEAGIGARYRTGPLDTGFGENGFYSGCTSAYNSFKIGYAF